MATLDPKFQRIARIQLSQTDQARLAASIRRYGNNWEHSSFDWFKKRLHKSLRIRQKDLCCYCRRPLRFDKGPVEIEHIIDKGSNSAEYAAYTFIIKNLALSCKDCNNNKGVKAVLRSPIPQPAAYPRAAKQFLWVHPHMHRYSDHLTIHQGWVYEASNQSLEGQAVITKCKLALLENKERKNRQVMVSTAQSLEHAISVAVSNIPYVGLDRLCMELAPFLSKVWKSHSAIEIETAIRDANVAASRAIARHV
ncbi:HNH endonuclease [Ralstonia pseudosolanacearum]